MSENIQKYEILIILPLTATDEELKEQAGKVEERIKAAGANVVSSAPLTKGKLPYRIKNNHQGYFHSIQFEMDPDSVNKFRRDLQLAGETLRFSISKVEGEFKPFIATAPQVRKHVSSKRAELPKEAIVKSIESKPMASEDLVQEKTSTQKVSMEEIDKKLEKILEE